MMGKSCKPISVEIHRQRSKRCDQAVNPQVKLFPTNQEWIVNILLYDITFNILRLAPII